jgi:MFS family permease
MLLKRNVPLMYVIGALMWGRFFIPVLALFYIASQVTLAQMSIILGVFSLSILLLEIPTGVLSDLIGRRNTLLLSRFMFVIEIFILCFFNGFWPFLIAKVISGIGVSLSSGTEQALLYETLKKQHRVDEHRRISGRKEFITSTSMAFVFVVGAFLFSLNNKLPAYVSLPIVTIGFILTFFLEEPYKKKDHITFKESARHFIEGCRLFFTEKKLVALTLFAIPIAAIFSMASSLSSAYFNKVLVPVALIGVVAALGPLLTALSSKREHSLEEKIGADKLMMLIQALYLLSVFLMIFLIPYVGAAIYLLLPFSIGLFNVFSNHHMNTIVSSKHRATMLSVKSMFENLAVFILFPIVGVFSKKTLGYSYLFLAAFLFVTIIIFVIYKNRNGISFAA